MSLRKLATPRTWASVVLTLLPLSVHGQALTGILAEAPSTGALLGEVRNSAGVTQMGAAIVLLDRYEHPIRRAISTGQGRFAFAGLTPGLYHVHVSLASFFPAIRRGIVVAAGSENQLVVNLSAILSSIDIVPGAPTKATLMSDEWKSVLRSSQPTRPVLRYLPEEYQPKPEATWASDTTGVIRVSGGDSNFLNNGLQQDMGTAFAVETSVSPTTRVRISGSLGYAAASGLPSASIRTSYARDRFGRPGPQISLMMRQAYFAAPVNGNQNAPALRTATVSSIDSVDLMDDLRLDYGFAIDSITLYGRMNYFSPFARATYTTDNGGEMKVAYSSGFAPTEMLARSPWRHGTFDADLAALTQAPRISRRNNEAAVERTKNYEVGYEFVDGKRTYSAMAFREEVGNAVFLMSGDIGLASAANLMPDLNSRGTVFNVGNYQRSGMQLAFTQMVNQLLEIVVAAGRAEALTSDGTGDASGTLREHMRQAPRTWATVRVNSSIPRTGTYLMTSYGWTDFRTLTPIHQSLTGPTYQDLGWNVRAQQPLPGMMGVRMELVAELRNALAQGYLTLHHKDGRKAVLTNTPRQARLGASFIF